MIDKHNGAVVACIATTPTVPIELGDIEHDAETEFALLLEEFADAESKLERTLLKRGRSAVELAAKSHSLAKMARECARNCGSGTP